MHLPDFSYEEKYWKNKLPVIGIDEVGRGAFAGPIGIGGVVFSSSLSTSKKDKLLSLGINDSKKMTSKKREELSLRIQELADWYGVCFIPVETINEIGIGEATFEGMRKVINDYDSYLEADMTGTLFALVDAFTIPGVDPFMQQGIIKGDCLSLSIASASIIAKVARDRLMEEFSEVHPKYDWVKNKGYGTLNHRKAIAQFGLTSLHRVAFCKKFNRTFVK